MADQVLTATRAGDLRGWATFDVRSDEVGLLGNYVADTEADAVELAKEDLS